jgi:hypothetical protein
MRGMDEPPAIGVESSAEPPLQFGIRDLLIAQAVVLAALGLLVMANIFGLLAIFIATLILCAWSVSPERLKLKRCVVDLLGGIVLPILCLVYDPGFLPDSGSIVYLAIATEMLILLVWLAAGRWSGRWSAVFAGALFVGTIVSGCIGALLALFGVIGLLLAGIGLLAFTPWMTCVVFTRNARRAMRQARAIGGRRSAILLFLAGVLLAAAIPASIYFSAGDWVEHALKLMPRPKPPFLH